MKSNPNRFWWTVIALGWAFDFLFWQKVPGINFALYVTLCLVAGFLLLRADGHQPKRKTLLLLPLIAIFAIMTFIRQEPMTTALSVIMTVFLMGLAAISYLGGRWPFYSLLDYLKGFLGLLGSMLARPLGFSAEVRQGAGRGRGEKRIPGLAGGARHPDRAPHRSHLCRVVGFC